MSSQRARRQGHLLGFVVSVLLHLGLLAVVLAGVRTPGDASGEGDGRPVPVSLAMFQSITPPETAEVAQAEPQPELTPAEPQPVAADEVQPQPDAVEQPEPEQQQRSEAAPPPEPRPESQPERKPEPAPKPARKPRPKPEPKPKSKPETEPKTKPEPRPAATATTRAAATTPAADSSRDKAAPGPQRSAPDQASVAALERQYLEGLRVAIEKHKFYPKRARRRGNEGQALVAFVLQKDGRISDIEIRRSSGTKLLDKAAVEALNKLARYQPIPEALKRRRWELRVPINFSLE